MTKNLMIQVRSTTGPRIAVMLNWRARKFV